MDFNLGILQNTLYKRVGCGLQELGLGWGLGAVAIVSNSPHMQATPHAGAAGVDREVKAPCVSWGSEGR